MVKLISITKNSSKFIDKTEIFRGQRRILSHQHPIFLYHEQLFFIPIAESFSSFYHGFYRLDGAEPLELLNLRTP